LPKLSGTLTEEKKEFKPAFRVLLTKTYVHEKSFESEEDDAAEKLFKIIENIAMDFSRRAIGQLLQSSELLWINHIQLRTT
jgi:hypothetical protein